MTMSEEDYWLQRYRAALESASRAPGDRSRTAYLDLARHYWSMHVLVRERSGSTPVPTSPAVDGTPPMRRAA